MDALNARLNPALEPLAIWTQTGNVKLPNGDVRLQHWWSARLTQVKAAALLEAAWVATCHTRKLTERGRRSAGCRPPSGEPRSLPGRRQLLHTVEVASRRAPLPADCAGRSCTLCGEPVDIFGDHAV